MTPPDTTPNPDNPCPWLAGHADGELDEATRRRVEDWVAADPRAAEVLRDQQQFAPGNAEFWAAVEPPAPGDEAWAAVRDGIARRCGQPAAEPARPDGGRYRVEFWAAVGFGAAVAMFAAWFALDRPDTPAPQTGGQVNKPTEVVEVAPPPRSADDPLAGYAVLPMPGPGDVLIESVRGPVSPWVIGPEQPVPFAMTFAAAADVDVEAVRPAEADGMMPDPQVKAGPTSPPMIYAARPR